MGYILLAYVYADGNDLEEEEINDREKKLFNSTTIFYYLLQCDCVG